MRGASALTFPVDFKRVTNVVRGARALDRMRGDEQNVKVTTRANLMLLLVSALWGASYPIVRMSVQDLSSHAFVFGRFALAVVLLFPLVVRNLRNKQAFRLGAVLGTIEGAVCAILTINMGKMPASRCALIMGLSVIMVPVWSALWGRHGIALMDLGRAALSLVGLYFLTGARLEGLMLTDVYIMAAAALWGLNIVILKRQTLKHQVEPRTLAFYQSVFTCLVPALGWMWTGAPMGHLSWTAVGGLAYCAVFASITCLILQTRYQKFTSAAQAGLRLSLEPLFACIFAVLILNEAVNAGMLLGGTLMMLATIMPELWGMLQERLAARPAHSSAAAAELARSHKFMAPAKQARLRAVVAPSATLVTPGVSRA